MSNTVCMLQTMVKAGACGLMGVCARHVWGVAAGADAKRWRSIGKSGWSACVLVWAARAKPGGGVGFGVCLPALVSVQVEDEVGVGAEQRFNVVFRHVSVAKEEFGEPGQVW